MEYPDASLAQTAALASETPRVQNVAIEASEIPNDKPSDSNSDKHSDNNVPTAADKISIDLTQGLFDKFRMFKSHMFTVTGTNLFEQNINNQIWVETLQNVNCLMFICQHNILIPS